MRNEENAYQSWLWGEVLLFGLLGATLALFSTYPGLRPTFELPQVRLVLVSAGFDAHVDDPLAGMRVTADGFQELASRSAELGPRLAAVLEGGYDPRTLPALVDAAREGFSK